MKPISPKLVFKSNIFPLSVIAHLSPSLINISTANIHQNKIYKTHTFTSITPYVTILTMFESISTSQDGMADEVSGNVVAELRKRGTLGYFSE